MSNKRREAFPLMVFDEVSTPTVKRTGSRLIDDLDERAAKPSDVMFYEKNGAAFKTTVSGISDANLSDNVTIIKVGENGDYLTIAEAVASISEGAPTDHSQAGHTVTGASGSHYIDVDQLSDYRDTEYINSHRWLHAHDGGGVNVPTLIGAEVTGGSETLSLCAKSKAATSADDHSLFELPYIVIILEAGVTHYIDTDLQLPEKNIYKISGQFGLDAHVHIRSGGKIRPPNFGGWCMDAVHVVLSDTDTASILNSATDAENASYGLLISWNNVVFSTPPSDPSGGIITSQLITVDSAHFRWIGSFYSVTPDPSTVILARFISSIIDVDISMNSDQNLSTRYCAVEFGFYNDAHVARYYKLINVRSHALSNRVHIASRDIDDGAYSDAPPVTDSFNCSILGEGSVVFNAIKNCTATGNRVYAWMENGADDCHVNSLSPIASSSLPSGKTYAKNTTIHNAYVSTGIVGAVDKTLEIYNKIVKAELAGASITLTSTPTMDCSMLAAGVEFYLYVNDIIGGNSLTIQDESALTDSGLILKTGASPAQLTIADKQMVKFMWDGTHALQISDPITFDTVPN